MSQVEPYIPLFINPAGLRVLVVGGGVVGTRRALMFKKAGARVTVAAMEFSEELKAAGVELRRVKLPEDLGILEGLIKESDIIVVAVGDDALASKVASIALSMGKLVNNAVNYREGNVIVPFSAYTSGFGIAVTSFGVSGLAARIALEKAVKLLEGDEEVKATLKALGRLKRVVRAIVSDPKTRMKLYEALEGDEELRSYLRRGDWRSAYLRGLEVIKSHKVPVDPSYYILLD